MATAGLALFPSAGMGFIGLAREPVSHEPKLYLTSLPDDLARCRAGLLDPMLATGRSVERGCRLVAERGCTDIAVVCAIAARPGIAHLAATGLVTEVVTVAVDESLNADGYVVPGMGDAGDRQFEDMVDTATTGA